MEIVVLTTATGIARCWVAALQPSVPFDWERLVIPTRWIARIVGSVYFVLYLASALMQPFGATPTTRDWVFLGVIGAGFVLATFWKDIGEVAGGLAFVGAALASAFGGGFELEGLLFAAGPLVIAGALFIACGWYVLAQGRRHTPKRWLERTRLLRSIAREVDMGAKANAVMPRSSSPRPRR